MARRLAAWREGGLLGLCALALLADAGRAEAFDISGGVGVGGMMAGTLPYLAISPHATLAWRLDAGFFIAAHGMVSVLPGDNGSLGVYSPVSIALTYEWRGRTFSVGPSLAAFYLSACGVKYCARTGGVAPGVHAQVEAYFLGPLGISVNGDVDWIMGDTSVLAGDVAGMVVAGPVVRWEREVNR